MQKNSIDEPFPDAQPSEKRIKRLDSWKEIGAYLQRDVTTVQRWEKLESMPVHRHLHSKRGSVYAYSSELDSWVESRKPQLEADDEQALAEVPMDVPTRSAPGPSRNLRLWVLVTLSAAVVLGAAYFIAHSRSVGSRAPIKSLAVLPLKNLSGDPNQEYLADGLTEALIGRLAAIHDLRVISRTSSMHFKDTKLSVPEIARALGVDAVVEGSVIRDATRIRVHAQLIRAATDEHFWSDTYDRELGDVLSLQSDVAQSIAEKVEVSITGLEHSRLVAARPVSPDVYEAFLKGSYAKTNTKDGIEQSIRYFEEAIRKDPTFAPAYLGLANAYDDLGDVLHGGRPGETRPKVISAAQKALELDPELAEAHVLLADTYREQWRWADAEREYKRALELSPNSAVAHYGFASWLLTQGRAEEALAWSRRARELDPLGISGLGWTLFQARHYDEAIQELRSVITVEPDSVVPQWFLGFALIAKGQPDQAIPVLEKALSLSGRSPAIMGVLVRAYAHAGRRPDALRLLAEMKKRSETGYVPAAAFVNSYLGLDDNEHAFLWLDKAYDEQSNILQWIKVHPYFDPLRNDPRFIELVRRMGLN